MVDNRSPFTFDYYQNPHKRGLRDERGLFVRRWMPINDLTNIRKPNIWVSLTG